MHKGSKWSETNPPQYVIYVVGDLIVDYYRILKESRLSPEAPVIVASEEYREYRLGGSANVANNIISLGENTKLRAIVGYDWGELAPNLQFPFELRHISADRPTIVKERLITPRQQLLRIDSKICPLSANCDSAFAHATCEDVKFFKPSVIVFSDYEHGALSVKSCQIIINAAKMVGTKIVVNSKSINTIEKYGGADLLILNSKEAADITGLRDPKEASKHLIDKAGLAHIAVTLGPDGILHSYIQNNDIIQNLWPTLDPGDDVVDVTGAGDTVTATMSIGLARKMSYDCIMKMANVAAGIVVKKRGVATASMDEVQEMIRSRSLAIDIGEDNVA